MKKRKTKRSDFTSVDQYIASFPKETQVVLKKIRATIRQVIPKAEQAISYQIPAFKLNGKFVIYFAGFAQHVSMYPIYADTKSLKKEIAPYVSGKATVKFSLEKPIPYGLIKKIVKYKVKEQITN